MRATELGETSIINSWRQWNEKRGGQNIAMKKQIQIIKKFRNTHHT